jgi:hypothetical protein
LPFRVCEDTEHCSGLKQKEALLHLFGIVLFGVNPTRPASRPVLAF